MSIWKLEPIDTSNDNWEASAHKGPALIRAADELQARTIAARAFYKAAERPPILGSELAINPWNKVELVSCSRATDTDFPEEGQDGVLEPPGYDDFSVKYF